MLVDGPRDDLESERLCFGKRRRGHVAMVGRPHRTAGRGHQPWHRAGKIIDVQPRRPWRCARPPALQGVAAASIDAEADALDLRRDAARDHERAPIEGLNADPCGQSRLAHRLHHGGDKRLRVRRVGARRRRQFGFNIEADMVDLRLPCQIEYLHQCLDADAIHSPLLRKGRGVGRSGLRASDVIALQLRQCQRTDRGPLGVEKLAVRRARVVGVETAVVADDENLVAGHGEIELERRHADRQRHGEGRERVFRRQTACTAVALQVKGDGHRIQDEADGNHRGCSDFRHGRALSSRRSVERPTLTTTARPYDVDGQLTRTASKERRPVHKVHLDTALVGARKAFARGAYCYACNRAFWIKMEPTLSALLSVVKTTIVLSAWPMSSSFLRTSPIWSSICFMPASLMPQSLPPTVPSIAKYLSGSTVSTCMRAGLYQMKKGLPVCLGSLRSRKSMTLADISSSTVFERSSVSGPSSWHI